MSRFPTRQRSYYNPEDPKDVYPEENKPQSQPQQAEQPPKDKKIRSPRGTAEYAQIKIRREAYNALKTLSSITGISVQHQLEEILHEGIDTKFKNLDLSKIMSW